MFTDDDLRRLKTDTESGLFVTIELRSRRLAALIARLEASEQVSRSCSVDRSDPRHALIEAWRKTKGEL